MRNKQRWMKIFYRPEDCRYFLLGHCRLHGKVVNGLIVNYCKGTCEDWKDKAETCRFCKFVHYPSGNPRARWTRCQKHPSKTMVIEETEFLDCGDFEPRRG